MTESLSTIDPNATEISGATEMAQSKSENTGSRRGVHLRRLNREQWLNRDDVIFQKLQSLMEDMELTREEMETYLDAGLEWIDAEEEREHQERIRRIQAEAEALGLKVTVPTAKATAKK